MDSSLEEKAFQNNGKKHFKKSKTALFIMLGMILGILFGFAITSWFSTGKDFIKDWISPWGTIFISMLKMIAVPLVFMSIYKGITSIQDIAKFSRMGLRTIILYMATTVFAITLGLIFVTTIKPGNLMNKANTETLINLSKDQAKTQIKKADKEKEKGPLSFLVNMVPNNVIASSSNNSKMLQIIFFSILCGIATIILGDEKTKSFKNFIDSGYEIILKIVDLVIKTAPIGVFALMSNLAASYAGNWGLFASLGIYAITVVLALFTLMFVFYPLLVKFFTKIPMLHFIKKMYPVQLFAFTTSSSAATLPVNLENAQEELGISKETSEFVLPVGTTINMDGTSCYQAIAVVFIAQVFGINLGLGDILSILLLTTISSIGTPAIPGGSYVILTMVLTSVGIPAEGLALILGVDRPLDMIRTSVNVTGDATVASIIDRSNNTKKNN